MANTLAELLRRRPTEEPEPEQIIDLDGLAVILQATLERTAVVRPLPDDGTRRLVRLEAILADDQALRWRARRSMDWMALQSRAKGRMNARRSHVKAVFTAQETRR